MLDLYNLVHNFEEDILGIFKIVALSSITIRLELDYYHHWVDERLLHEKASKVRRKILGN